jgi:hypothetical protein
MADIQVAQFKAQQLLGQKMAGFEHAVQWSTSSDHELRRNAVTVFAGIMDRDSRQYLQQLAKDPFTSVALGAQVALKVIPTQVPSLHESQENIRYVSVFLLSLFIGLLVIGVTLLLIIKKPTSRGK